MFTFKRNMHNKAILIYSYTLKRKMGIKKRAHGFTKFIGEILIPETSSHTWSSHSRFLSRLLKLCIKCLLLCFGKFCTKLCMWLIIKITSKIILKHKECFAFPISLCDYSQEDTSLSFFLFSLLLFCCFTLRSLFYYCSICCLPKELRNSFLKIALSY